MLESAAEAYFKYKPDTDLEEKLAQLLKSANQFSGRRNDIAHGIVNPYIINIDESTIVNKGYVLYPAYYATRKRKLPEKEPFAVVTPAYIYSSVEIDKFGVEFGKLANTAIEITADLAHRAHRARVHQ